MSVEIDGRMYAANHPKAREHRSRMVEEGNAPPLRQNHPHPHPHPHPHSHQHPHHGHRQPSTTHGPPSHHNSQNQQQRRHPPHHHSHHHPRNHPNHRNHGHPGRENFTPINPFANNPDPTAPLIPEDSWKHGIFACCTYRDPIAGKTWCPIFFPDSVCLPCCVLGTNMTLMTHNDHGPYKGALCRHFHLNLSGFCMACSMCVTLGACVPAATCIQRYLMFEQYNIKGGCLNACCVGCLCSPCALTQQSNFLYSKHPDYRRNTVWQRCLPEDQSMV